MKKWLVVALGLLAYVVLYIAGYALAYSHHVWGPVAVLIVTMISIAPLALALNYIRLHGRTSNRS